jgi:hypothetical protein
VIARPWRRVTRADDADAYLAYLKKTGLADYRATSGNRGVIVQRAIDGDRAIFELTTFWESEQAIARFAGAMLSVVCAKSQKARTPKMMRAACHRQDRRLVDES